MPADKKKTFLSRSIRKLRLSLLLPAAAARNFAANSAEEFVWIGGGGRGIPATRVGHHCRELPPRSPGMADSSDGYEEIRSLSSRQSSSRCRRRQRQPRTSTLKRSFLCSQRKSSLPTANNRFQFVLPNLYSNNNTIRRGVSPDFKIYEDISTFCATIGNVEQNPVIETEHKIQQRLLNTTKQLQRSKGRHTDQSQRSSTLHRSSAADKNPRRFISSVSINDVIALPTPPPQLPPRMSAAGPLVRRRLYRDESEADIIEPLRRRAKAEVVGKSRERLYAFSEEIIDL